MLIYIGIGTVALFIVLALFSSWTKSAAAAMSHDEPVLVKIVDIQRKALETLVIFETMDGERISFNLAPQRASTFVVGDVGMLTYHKTVVKSFERQLQDDVTAQPDNISG